MLKTLLKLYASFLVGLSFFRFLLSAYFYDRLSDISSFALFTNGIHTDLMATSILLTPLTFCFMTLRAKFILRIKPVILAYLSIGTMLLVGLELASFAFIREYDVRPNRLLYEYLAYPKEVLTTTAKAAPVNLAFIFLEIFAAPIVSWKFFDKILSKN